VRRRARGGHALDEAELVALRSVGALLRRRQRRARRLLVAAALRQAAIDLLALALKLRPPLGQALRLAAESREILLVRDDGDVALVAVLAQPVERRPDLGQLGLDRDLARRGVGEVALEAGADLVELAQLAFLRQDARAGRLPR